MHFTYLIFVIPKAYSTFLLYPSFLRNNYVGVCVHTFKSLHKTLKILKNLLFSIYIIEITSESMNTLRKLLEIYWF